LLTQVLPLQAAPKNQPRILSLQAGKLVYDQDERGNRVPDFSTAGYAGGDRAIPEAPIKITVDPNPSGDNTANIQRAIDYVATLPADSNGLRGAVLLLQGRHQISGNLLITNSGVVLRGCGANSNGTTLVAAGLDRRTLIRIAGEDDSQITTNAEWKIADEYVPVGATSFNLRSAEGLNAGNSIRVIRPSTQEWIDLLDANEFGGGIGGGWKPGSRDIAWDRVIKSVEGNRVTVDAPITTALEFVAQTSKSAVSQVSKPASAGTERRAELETNAAKAYVVFCKWPGGVQNIGIENLTLESVFDSKNPKDENHSWCAITMENVRDAWVRQVTFKHFAGSAVALYESVSCVTVQDCLSLAPVSEDGGYRRNTFFTMGQQTLFLRCYSEHGRHDFSIGHCAAGPNAFVQCEARLPLSDSGAIESWASGILFDNVNIDGNELTLGFIPGSGKAIGWAAANSVLWNCSAAIIRCENPPGAQNWAFGCWAEFSGNGIWRDANNFVSPVSLYAAQLEERVGADAANRLQLMPRPHEESSNPPLDKAQELAAAAHEPAPLLSDYIAKANERDPIPTHFKDVIRAEDLANAKLKTPNPKHLLVLTNGWLTLDGKLLIGGTADVSWWRGTIRPDDADDAGLGVTRFVPGRIGRGFTDDLSEVADAMITDGDVALDHNYGLWYDRRRDDHERVRRMNGEVRPPFYELPFARSGQGTAWDGLSKYDLTKFNPWYWNRLRQFAEVCATRGLVLFHENYFQHNIIEAGAHWADFPWRSANNINETGFPEPPPYAGDKRIFQAELFYDVTHPVRRKLHEAYIRQCLENFKTNSNVIQFTAAEFTGPLKFVQFWLDTIAAWENENAASNSKPLIALSTTKDVQDAILADAKRSEIVDVIDFRYWWQTDKGLFAPPGGKNLSPRQFERQWRGGRASEFNLAQMAAEYRERFPAKALICDFENAGWAWVCAGGSLPRLPKSTDAKLLAAISQMKFWPEASTHGCWVLREPGKQMLIYSRETAELDLTDESGAFRINIVNPKTGEVTRGETVSAGRKVNLPNASVIWLTKEQ
jgi:hypothetical protein